MAKYGILLAVIGLIIVITSVVQIVLELAPARTQTITQLIAVTVPREIVEKTKIVTMTREKPVTVTLTRTMLLPTTVTTTKVISVTHTRSLSITVPTTITETAVVTVTKTVVGYVEYATLLLRISNLSPGTAVRVYPDNRSYTIVETARINVINLATIHGAKPLCDGCNAKVVSYGPWKIVELNITNTRASFRITLEKPIAVDHGMLWLYIPWGSKECPDLRYLDGVELSMRVIVGDTLVDLEARKSGRIAGLCAYSIPLEGPQLNGIDLEMKVSPHRSPPVKIYVMPVIAPRYRPLTIVVEPPTGLLKYALENNHCEKYARYVYCGIDTWFKASIRNPYTSYSTVKEMILDYIVDLEPYVKRGVIQILEADNVVTVAIPLLPATNTSISIDLELRPTP